MRKHKCAQLAAIKLTQVIRVTLRAYNAPQKQTWKYRKGQVLPLKHTKYPDALRTPKLTQDTDNETRI